MLSVNCYFFLFAECTLPLEFCEFMPDAVLQRCCAWRAKNQDLLKQEGVSLASLSIGTFLILFCVL